VTVHTVDVSHHDWERAGGRLDWDRVAAAGIAAVCVRASYGDPSGARWPSPHAGEMMRGAGRAGMAVGGYHNLVRGDTASVRRQVDWLRREMDGGSASWAMVDVERYEELLAAGREPRIGDVRAWCVRWHAVEARPLLMYLPRWVWQHMGSPELRSLGCPLVASDYGANAAGAPAELYASRGGDGGRGWQPYGGVTPTLWQYGSEARVPGLSSKTDINAFRGTPSELRALLGGGDDMQLSDVVYERTAPDGSKVGRSLGSILGTLDVLALRAEGRLASLQQDSAAVRTVLAGIVADPGNTVQLSDSQVSELAELLTARMPTADAVADAVIAEIAS
jgi:hypothetical protein